MFIRRGVTKYQETSNGDCVASSAENADRFHIYLEAGSRLTVGVDDLSYSEHGLWLTDADRKIVAVADAAIPYVDTLNFTAPASGYYVINVSGQVNDNAEYTLSVH